MAPGGDCDAQQMIDLFIHDYMLRNNMLTTAEIFSEEAHVGAERPNLKDAPDGFLKEWWHIFWDKYSSGMPKHLEAMEGSSVKATQIMGNEQLNQFPPAPNPDMNQQGGMQFQGNSILDNMLMEQLEASLSAATMCVGKHCGLPAGELNSNQLVGVDNMVHPDPSSSNARNCQLQTHVGDQQWTPGDNYDAHMEGPRHRSSTVNEAPEAIIPRAEPPDARNRNSPNSTMLVGWPLIGKGQILSGVQYPVLNSFVPAPNRQSLFQTLIPHHQQDISSQGMENTNWKQMSSFQGSTDRSGNHIIPMNGFSGADGQMIMRQPTEQQIMVPNTPTLEQQMIISNPMKQVVEQKMTDAVGIGLEDNKKNQQLQQKLREKKRKRKSPFKKDKVSNGKNSEVKKSLDDDIKSPPDNGNAEIVSASSGRFSLTEQNGFFFEEVASLDASKGKVLCCHFSSDGKLLASAGDDMKVLLWNLKRYNRVESAEGHTDIITDVRFKPNSHVFATSSFDRTVQIWDPNNLTKPLCKLLGHFGRVNSLDFHPDGDLLCSCDSNDEIKLWTIDRFACIHTFKGATRQVRFQPRSGTLLAAPSGKGIKLFDVETNILRYYLEGHVKEVKSICWDVSGDYLASVSEESARVWCMTYGGECVHELQSNGNKFESCAFHPKYANVIIIGSNQSLEV